MSGVPVVLAAAAVLIALTACGGPGTAPGSSGGPVTPTSPSAHPVASSPPWPERGMVLTTASLGDASLVLDPAAGVLYALVAPPAATSQYAPWVLEAIDLRTGRVRRGESYQGVSLALAAGFLWVYVDPGPGRPLVLDEVGRGTLTTIRSVPMPGSPDPAGVAAGPAGSVWAGAGRTLLRVSVGTGAVLARAVLPPGLDLTDLAAGPGGENVYAAAVRPFPPGGAIVCEYSVGTGGLRLLAQFDGAALKWSGGGALLTAVPGGVWVYFRDGMGGQSGLLSARSLSVIRGLTTVVSRADSPVTGSGTVYDWFSYSDSAYGGGSLWVVTPGLVACVNPVTGRVRAEETEPFQAPLYALAMAADRAARQVVAVTSTTNNTTGVMTISVVTITPPADCWR